MRPGAIWVRLASFALLRGVKWPTDLNKDFCVETRHHYPESPLQVSLFPTPVNNKLSKTDFLKCMINVWKKQKTDTWKLFSKSVEFKQLTNNVWCLKPISLNIANPALNSLIDFSSVLSLWKQQRSINRSGEAETAPAEGLLGAVPDLWWFWLRATRHWQNRKQAGSEHAPQAQMRLLFGQVSPYCF